jgi:hypothetical protein
VKFRGYGLAVALLAGCSGEPDLMPMKVGTSITYVVTHGLQRYVEPVKVTGTVPILGRTGYELSGPMGVSRFVWKDGVLYASQASNARFNPPIPLVASDGKIRKWSGKLEALDSVTDATAEMVQKADKLSLGPNQINTTMSVLTVTMSRGSIELTTWFQAGVGIVQQEQRTGPELVLRMEMLGGPKSQ